MATPVVFYTICRTVVNFNVTTLTDTCPTLSATPRLKKPSQRCLLISLGAGKLILSMKTLPAKGIPEPEDDKMNIDYLYVYRDVMIF